MTQAPVPEESFRAGSYDRYRRELVSYATRMVLRDEVAQELIQEAAVRLLAEQKLPNDDAQIRVSDRSVSASSGEAMIGGAASQQPPRWRFARSFVRRAGWPVLSCRLTYT